MMTATDRRQCRRSRIDADGLPRRPGQRVAVATTWVQQRDVRSGGWHATRRESSGRTDAVRHHRDHAAGDGEPPIVTQSNTVLESPHLSPLCTNKTYI